MVELPKGSLIASGPVIIEDGKVLLNKHGDDDFWKFPGGRVETFDMTLEEAAKREVREEMGLEVELLRPLKPVMQRLEDGRIIILIHYEARRLNDVTPGEEIREWGWYPIDNLPESLAPNITLVLESIK